MSTLEVIKTRRSVRSYLNKQVSDEDAIKVLDAARLAPSGGNRQRWKFIYIKDSDVLRMVKNCSPGFYGDAAAAIVIGVRPRRDAYERERARAFHRENHNLTNIVLEQILFFLLSEDRRHRMAVNSSLRDNG